MVCTITTDRFVVTPRSHHHPSLAVQHHRPAGGSFEDSMFDRFTVRAQPIFSVFYHCPASRHEVEATAVLRRSRRA
ncbi:hypothetical protein V6N12_047699 [Hibiscus sabdariffa]|uniref:Uncharacterized protein n=1 Tax=Hibiscus sabdariffa TaxID=183260 RepID=A0ABR2CUG7_9ROSI